jgi:CheY-like chemotaxis protein
MVRDEVVVADVESQPIQFQVEAFRLASGSVLLHLQDTTAALRARSALDSAEALHRAAMEALPGVAWTMALPEERVIEVSPAVEPLFGCQPAELLQRHGAWDELAHPGDRERVRAEFRAGVATGSPFDIHFAGLHHDRRSLPHLVSHVVPVGGERGWVDRAHGLIEDLSARDALAEQLADVRSHLRHVLDVVSAGVLVVRVRRDSAEVVLCNRHLAQMMRLDEPIRPGTGLANAPADLRRLLQGAGGPADLLRRLTSEEADEFIAELHEPVRVLRTYAGPLRDTHGAVVGRILTAEDITTNWMMERRLAQAQKMESMGRLAGGVAHDFNNLLGTILGFSSLLLEQTPAPDPRRESLGQIVDAAERAARLTEALLGFSRSARFERVPVQLNRVIEDAYQLLRSALDPAVSVVLSLTPDLPLLLGDALLLQQVLVNLAQETRERLGTGGTLTLVTSLVLHPPPREIRAEGEPRRAVSLEIFATSGGVRHAPVEPMADRAGLTLTMVEDIVRAHGGWFVTAADPNDPAFRVVFPVDAPEETPLLVPAAVTAHGHETVLVVDDEPGLRALARVGLQQRGFDVVAVETGEQALDILRRGEPRVDAMLLDLTLPGISGESVLRAVRGLVPSLPVIIASGYATVESQSAWMAAGAMGFVAKPYRVQEIAERLREALDRSQPRVS